MRGKVSLYCTRKELRSDRLPAVSGASLELTKERVSDGQRVSRIQLGRCVPAVENCLSEAGNDGVTINIWLGGGSLSPASMCHHVSLDDGRHASQLGRRPTACKHTCSPSQSTHKQLGKSAQISQKFIQPCGKFPGSH